jgi:hypothetical protein
MKKTWIFLLLLLSPLVFALGEKTFTFTPPTEYELTQYQIDNGLPATPLPQSAIASYDIECDGSLLVNLPNVPLNTDTYQAPAGTFATGNHACQAFTVTTEGVRSGPSNTVNFTVEPGVPGAPINFVVQ